MDEQERFTGTQDVAPDRRFDMAKRQVHAVETPQRPRLIAFFICGGTVLDDLRRTGQIQSTHSLHFT